MTGNKLRMDLIKLRFTMPKTRKVSIIPHGFRENQDKVAKTFKKDQKNALERLAQKKLKRRKQSRKQSRKQKRNFKALVDVASECYNHSFSEQNQGPPPPNGREVVDAFFIQLMKNHRQQDQQQQQQQD